MKRFLSLLLCISVFASFGQHTGATYTNSKGQVLSKPAAVNGPLPSDHKSKYYDESLFAYRPYISRAEVLSYLGNQRYQGLKVWIDTVGTFNSSTGVISNGQPVEYVFGPDLQLRPYIVNTLTLGYDTLRMKDRLFQYFDPSSGQETLTLDPNFAFLADEALDVFSGGMVPNINQTINTTYNRWYRVGNVIHFTLPFTGNEHVSVIGYRGPLSVFLPPTPAIFTPASSNFRYNVVPANSGGNYVDVSYASELPFTTNAVSAKVTLYSNYYAYLAKDAKVSVYVNGVYNQSISATGQGPIVYNITLPSGLKSVVFRTGTKGGGQTNTPIGTFVTKVEFPTGTSNTIQPFTRKSEGVVCVTNSIGVGIGTTIPERDGWLIKVRDSISSTRDFYSEGWGGVQTSFMYGNTNRSQYVGRVTNTLSPYSVQRMIFTQITNDFGFNQTTPSAVQTVLTQLFADLHTALPNLTINVLSPIARLDSTNGQGQTLQNYRDAELAAVNAANSAAGTVYITYADGSRVVSLSNLDPADGVHPLNAGAVQIANKVITFFAPSQTDANLSALAFNNFSLTPSFSANTTTYAQTVVNSISTTNATATTNAGNATLTVGGASATSGVPVTKALSVGTNSIPVVVTAGNGSTTKTYNVTVNRSADNYFNYATTANNVTATSNAHEYTSTSSGDAVDLRQLSGDYTIWFDIKANGTNDFVASGLDNNTTINSFSSGGNFNWRYTFYVTNSSSIRRIHAIDNGIDVGGAQGLTDASASDSRLGYRKVGNIVYLMQDVSGTITTLYTFSLSPSNVSYTKVSVAQANQLINNALLTQP